MIYDGTNIDQNQQLKISGRILNRFSKDIGCMDELLPPTFFDVFAVITDIIYFVT